MSNNYTKYKISFIDADNNFHNDSRYGYICMGQGKGTDCLAALIRDSGFFKDISEVYFPFQSVMSFQFRKLCDIKIDTDWEVYLSET